MSEPIYSEKIGDLLVIQITGCLRNFIAQVIQESPLRLKVEESGPYANLRDGDFIILREESLRIQDKEDGERLLQEEKEAGRPLVSGLAIFGIKDGKLHEIIPSE